MPLPARMQPAPGEHGFLYLPYAGAALSTLYAITCLFPMAITQCLPAFVPPTSQLPAPTFAHTTLVGSHRTRTPLPTGFSPTFCAIFFHDAACSTFMDLWRFMATTLLCLPLPAHHPAVTLSTPCRACFYVSPFAYTCLFAALPFPLPLPAPTPHASHTRAFTATFPSAHDAVPFAHHLTTPLFWHKAT